ncbi:MAG: cytochrome d ubiquinol oxidase subunit II [Halobacteria archaeon]|nr:cytochrome d ubiquinol oxidase subunit II [Halobacteria archaeon]
MILTLSTHHVLGLPLQEIWFGLIFFILGMFVFLDGFDFGAGIIFAFEDHEAQEKILAAIGPFWDGNEVWLVVFGGALFAAFPGVYANLFSRNYLLMFAILGSLIIRGLAPEFYEQRHDETWQKWWGRAFIFGSTASPFFLGAFTSNWLLGATSIVNLPAVVVGAVLVALTVLDGAAFLSVKTDIDVSKHGVRSAVAYLGLLVAGLGYIYVFYPGIRESLVSPLPLGLVGLSLGLTVVYVYSISRKRNYVAFASAAGLAFGLVAYVAAVMFPLVDPATGLRYDEAIVSTLPLNLMTIGSAILMPLIFVYFGILYTTMWGKIESAEGY